MDEVASLVTILEHHRWSTVEKPRAKDRSDTRVRIRECLARPVGVEVTQRYDRDVVRLPNR
jgi:hypothetical protein